EARRAGGSGIGMVIDETTGTCATGFVRCYGICMESAAIGADCRPLSCAAPAAGATAPARTTISSRGFDWNVTVDGTVTFKPGKGIVNQATLSVDLYYRTN